MLSALVTISQMVSVTPGKGWFSVSDAGVCTRKAADTGLMRTLLLNVFPNV